MESTTKKILRVIATVLFLSLLFGCITTPTAMAAASKVKATFIKQVVHQPLRPGFTPIRSIEDLESVEENLSGKYQLMNDLDFSGITEWKPIGGEFWQQFEGVFDGNGCLIRGINLTYHYLDDLPIILSQPIGIGLFAGTRNAIIENLGIEEGEISVRVGPYGVRGVVVGAIIGFADEKTTIRNCYNLTNIYLERVTTSELGESGAFAGGLVGALRGRECRIEDSFNQGDVRVESQRSHAIAGGVTSSNSGTILRCYNTGNISTQMGPSINSYNFTGGITGGANEGSILDCYNWGEITADSASPIIGGISGIGSGVIKNTYNKGLITKIGMGGSAGALVGEVGEGTKVLLQNCYYLASTLPAATNPHEQELILINVDELQEIDFGWEQNFPGFDFRGVWRVEPGNAPIFRIRKEIVVEIGFREWKSLSINGDLCETKNIDIRSNGGRWEYRVKGLNSNASATFLSPDGEIVIVVFQVKITLWQLFMLVFLGGWLWMWFV